MSIESGTRWRTCQKCSVTKLFRPSTAIKHHAQFYLFKERLHPYRRRPVGYLECEKMLAYLQSLSSQQISRCKIATVRVLICAKWRKPLGDFPKWNVIRLLVGHQISFLWVSSIRTTVLLLGVTFLFFTMSRRHWISTSKPLLQQSISLLLSWGVMNFGTQQPRPNCLFYHRRVQLLINHGGNPEINRLTLILFY